MACLDEMLKVEEAAIKREVAEARAALDAKIGGLPEYKGRAMKSQRAAAKLPTALIEHQRFCEEALAPFRKRLAEAEERLAFACEASLNFHAAACANRAPEVS